MSEKDSKREDKREGRGEGRREREEAKVLAYIVFGLRSSVFGLPSSGVSVFR